VSAYTVHVFGIETRVVSFDGGTYFVPQYAAHRPVSRAIAAQRYSEPELHQLVGRVFDRYPGSSMIHAGTFFGDMLVSFSRAAGTLYAFEPVIENYLLARQVVEVNQLGNVALYHAGLGAAPGPAAVVTHDAADGNHRGGGSKVVESGGDGVSQCISLLTVDGFALDDLAMLQLDVEGFEYEVLRGAVRTIEALRPVIVVEDFRNNCGPLLESLGYRDRAKIAARNRMWLTDDRAKDLGYD
jgi:FkbM family methyltransferase